MRRIGYRFSPNSLTAVLSYEPWIVRFGWRNEPIATQGVREEMRRMLELANGMTLGDVLRRVERQVERELMVFNERLESA
jgi:hypothetical protein